MHRVEWRLAPSSGGAVTAAPPRRLPAPAPPPPQVDHVKAERNVLAEVQHHSIVKLYYSFQDEEFLYLVGG